MKLLVFAHIPPPHHGQSYMVQRMIEGLGGDQRQVTGPPDPALPVACYNVNCRYSIGLEDIGSFRFEKAWLVVRYSLEAIWCRFRHGIKAFYYIPAPGKRAALYRDWMVMLLCRPFFKHIIHHWHAVGLGDWLQREAHWLERAITRRLLGEASLGIALAIPSMRDALWFCTRRVEIVANGIPDPCPDFATLVQPQRLARLSARRRLLAGEPAQPGDSTVYRVLYLAHCMREKGLFDTLDGVALANAELSRLQSPLRIELTVAGEFVDPEEERAFAARLAEPDLAAPPVTYAGFVSGAAKQALLQDCDCLCFPTYYHAESFGLVIVEAMAAGMNVVATRWRATPEILPIDHPGFVPARDPAAVGRTLNRMMSVDSVPLRAAFERQFTEARHLAMLEVALGSLELGKPPTAA